MKNEKLKGFTFVELLLVMLVLGIIISLTLPIIKGIKDDDDIHRAYMKKANQDVVDAMNMIFVKENKFTGMEMLKKAYENPANNNFKRAIDYYIDSNNNSRCNTLRNLFNAGLNTRECGTCRNVAVNCYAKNGMAQNCTTIDFKYKNSNGNTVSEGITTQPGLVIGGKPVLVFKYGYDDGTGGGVGSADDPIYGYVFVDMNKDKGPNEMCKDRYKFRIYNDRVAMETDSARGGCPWSL